MTSWFGRSGQQEKDRRDELLSAYLDGELDDEERQLLEARLAGDAELRGELRAMTQTVSLVHELPRVAAPRNFILTQSMAASQQDTSRETIARARTARRWAWAAPLLTAATTVVSLLFAVVVVGDLLLSGAGRMASAPAPMQQQEEAPAVMRQIAPTPEVEEESLDASDLGSPPAPPSETASKDVIEEPQMAVEEEVAMATAESTEAPQLALESEPAAEAAGPTWTAELAVEGEAETESLGATEAPQMALEEEAVTDAARATQSPVGAGTLAPPTTTGRATEDVAELSVSPVAPAVSMTAGLTSTIPPQEPVVSESELGVLEPTPEEIETAPPLIEKGRDVDRQGPLPWRALEVALGVSSLALVYATVLAWRRRP